MKITNLTKEGVGSAIVERVLNMGNKDINQLPSKQTYTLIIEPENRDSTWLLISIQEEENG